MSSGEKSPVFVTSKWDLAGESWIFIDFDGWTPHVCCFKACFRRLNLENLVGEISNCLVVFLRMFHRMMIPTFFFSGTPTKWYQYFFCLTIWRGSLILCFFCYKWKISNQPAKDVFFSRRTCRLHNSQRLSMLLPFFFVFFQKQHYQHLSTYSKIYSYDQFTMVMFFNGHLDQYHRVTTIRISGSVGRLWKPYYILA